jgi:hypothetical protein
MHEKFSITNSKSDCFVVHRMSVSYTVYGVPNEK